MRMTITKIVVAITLNHTAISPPSHKHHIRSIHSNDRCSHNSGINTEQ